MTWSNQALQANPAIALWLQSHGLAGRVVDPAFSSKAILTRPQTKTTFMNKSDLSEAIKKNHQELIAKHAKAIAEKDKIIAEKDRQIAERDAELAQLKAKLQG